MSKRKQKKFSGVKFKRRNKFGEYVYMIDFYPCPKAKRIYKQITLSKKSDREAYNKKEEMRVEYRKQHRTPNNLEKENLSFEELRERLIISMESGQIKRDIPCAKKTISKAKNVFDLFFFDFLSDKYPTIKTLHNFPTGIFQDFKEFIVNERGLKWRAAIMTLKPILSRFVKGGYCNKKLLERLREIPTPEAEEKEFNEITITQKKRLLAYIKKDKPAYFGITFLLARLGWRITETLSVKRRNVKFKGVKPIAITIEGKFRKNRKPWTCVAIDEQLSNEIAKCYKNNKSKFLFPNGKGNMHNSNHYRDYLSEVSQEVIGKEITPHDFRHSVVTQLLDLRVSPKDIMSLTGHNDVEVLIKRYSHSTQKGRIRALSGTML